MSTNDTLADQSTPPTADAAPFAPAEIAGIAPPMVGRDDELQRLIAALYAVIEGGPPRLVSVVGPAGIGKSRLAHEFRQVIGRLPEPVTLLTLHADRQSARQPYSLVRLLVAALFRIREGDPPAVARARIEYGIAQLLGADSEEKAHLLGQLAGYDFAESPHLRGPMAEPRQLRDRALLYAAQCIKALTTQAPLVLLLDDFHHGDDSSVEAVAQVVRDSGDAALLVVCLAQGRLYEHHPTWDRAVDGRGERIDLAPLDERTGRRLIGEILRKAGKLPSDLRNLIVGRAEGNPYYVEELIKMLIADGVIVPGEPTWTVQQGRLSRLRVPPTLADLLRTRINALTPAERDLLVRAAIVGRFFWAEAAAELGGLANDGEGPGALLCRLEAADLVVPVADSRFAGQREYAFRHELLHEVAYHQAPPELRAALHLRVAAWLTARGEGRPGAFAGLIAEHHQRGGDLAGAACWYIRAGQHARETHSVSAATQYFQTALGLLPDEPAATPERIACYEGLGHALRAAARLAEAAANFLQMAIAADELGDLRAAARAHNLRAETLDDAMDYQGSWDSANRAIAMAEAVGDRVQLATGIRHLAFAEMRFERPAESRVLGEQAMTIMEELGDLEGAALCRGLLGLLCEMEGDYAGAMARVGETLEAYRATGNLSEVATQLNNLGWLANAQGDFVGALAFLREGLEVSRAIGSRVCEIFLVSNLGNSLNGLGDAAAAEAECRRGIEMSELSRMPVLIELYIGLSEALLRQGHAVEAVEAAQQALEGARKGDSPREVAAAWRALGRAIGAMSDSQGAPACFAESARLYGEINARAELGRVLRAWAEHELHHGDAARGVELWDEARATFATAGLTHELDRTPASPPRFEP